MMKQFKEITNEVGDNTILNGQYRLVFGKRKRNYRSFLINKKIKEKERGKK